MFSTPAARAHKARVLEDMRAVRPVVETGYENVVQVRLLLEGTPVDDMLARWRCVLPWEHAAWRVCLTNDADTNSTRQHTAAGDDAALAAGPG